MTLADEPELVVTQHELPDVPIAYEDEHILVVDKPAGLVVHSGAGHSGDTLVDALAGQARRRRSGAARDRAPPRPRHVRADGGGAHRGRVRAAVAARPRPCARAHVRGARRGPAAVAHAGGSTPPIGRDRHDPTRISLDSDSARDAVTHFEVERAVRPPRAAARAARDRADAPDPGAPGRDRSAGGRRSRLRRAERRASGASSCTRRSSRSRIRSPVSGSSSLRAPERPRVLPCR